MELKLFVIQVWLATCPESHAVAEKNTRDYGHQLKWYTKVHVHASMLELGSSSPSITLHAVSVKSKPVKMGGVRSCHTICQTFCFVLPGEL